MSHSTVKIHWVRKEECWAVRYNGRTEHYLSLEISAPLSTVIQKSSPRAYLKTIARVIPHDDHAEIVP